MDVKIPIEIDVTYVNKAWYSIRRGNPPKRYVIGFFQRGIHGKTPNSRIVVLDDNKPETIMEAISGNVPPNAFLYAEENVLPESVKELYDLHEFKINDVNKEVHVSNVKNMWKDLKRNLKQVYISVSREYLQGYCNEVTWKINNAHLSHSDRFHKLLGIAIETSPTSQKNLVKKKHSTLPS